MKKGRCFLFIMKGGDKCYHLRSRGFCLAGIKNLTINPDTVCPRKALIMRAVKYLLSLWI